MKRKELKALLWNVIGPIDIPSDVKKLYSESAIRPSNNPERYLIFKDVFFPNQQEKLFFSKEKNDKQATLVLAIDLLEEYLRIETDPIVLQYFSELHRFLGHNTDSEKLEEAEHDMLCRLIQIYLTNETLPVFKRVIIVIFLFSDYFRDIRLLDTIFCYYNIYKLKIM